jgi:hypothetical protein
MWRLQSSSFSQGGRGRASAKLQENSGRIVVEKEEEEGGKKKRREMEGFGVCVYSNQK